MATIQLKRKTSTGTGPLIGKGTIKQGEPLVDLNGGNLYISKVNKVGTTSAPLSESDYLEFVNKENLVGVINGSIDKLKLGTAAKYNVGTKSGNIPVLDSYGMLDSKVIPQIALTDTFIANSDKEMTSLTTAQVGDICIRNDLSKTFILKQDGYATLSNWQELKTPTDQVTSVNGKKGVVNISLSELNGVNKTDFNAHVNDLTHLTKDDRESLTSLYMTDIKSDNGGFSVKYVNTIDDIYQECITDGILIHYNVNTDYNPTFKEIRLGINSSKVLTPDGLIDGGTF